LQVGKQGPLHPANPQGANLFYFRRAGAARPLGVVPLERCFVAAEQLFVPPAPGAALRVLHTLQIALPPDVAARSPHAAYLLAAPTPELQAGRGSPSVRVV
jgi:hypothetical protein